MRSNLQHPAVVEAKATGKSIWFNETCWKSWPDVTNCVQWWTNETAGMRYAESNNVPEYAVPPYCPFGIGQGYCKAPSQGNSSECDPFPGLLCPCDPGTDPSCPANTTAAGDVMVPTYELFEFPLRPDPTDASKPKHMYDNSALTNGNAYQVIGAMYNGVQIKGPAEANGFNVDTSLIPLPCGDHVTPPVGPGPLVGFASDGHGIYGFGDATGAPVLDEC